MVSIGMLIYYLFWDAKIYTYFGMLKKQQQQQRY